MLWPLAPREYNLSIPNNKDILFRSEGVVLYLAQTKVKGEIYYENMTVVTWTHRVTFFERYSLWQLYEQIVASFLGLHKHKRKTFTTGTSGLY
jgi:hypothetical protein